MYPIDSSDLYVNYMAIFGPPLPKKKDTEVIVLNTII